MMGQNDKPQKPLFYAFNLDELVPQDHLLRKIDHFLDLSDLHEHLAPYYSQTGRSSVDPELMIRMLIIGYCLGIRSERRLCEEVKLNLAYRWFCRLSIEDPTGPLDLLQEPSWPLPESRSLTLRIRTGAAKLHRCRAGGW